MRAHLQQLNDQEWKWLIAYYTQKLMSMKQKYDIHDQEMLAIIEALE